MGYESGWRAIPKPEKQPKKQSKGLIKKPKSATGEKALFDKLYKESNKRCQITDKPLLPPEHDLYIRQFSHCLTKAAYPSYRLEPSNIVLMLPECHYDWEFNRHKIKGDPKWQWHFELEEELKEQYHK